MDYQIARHNMVENQVRTNKVTDPLVIAAMEEVPRELFLPEAKRGVAYVDEDIAVGGGRYAMEPMVMPKLPRRTSPLLLVRVTGMARHFCRVSQKRLLPLKATRI